MKAVVSGAAGFIGSHLCEALLAKGHQVIGIDNFHAYYNRETKERNLAGFRDHAHFEFINASILDVDALKAITDVDAVFHFAAIAGVRYSIEHPLPYVSINVQGTANMLTAFQDVKKFVFASSSSVYGDVPEDQLPVREDAPLRPIAPYPLSKIHAEQLCERFNEWYGTPVSMLRFYTVYGARQRPDEMFTTFITRLLQGQPIEIFGDGNQTRDFTHVSDIINGAIQAYAHGHGIYNLGSGRRVSVNDAVQEIVRQLGITPEIRHGQQRQGDVRHTHADISKAQAELGYRPAMSLEDGVKDCIAWCKELQTA